MVFHVEVRRSYHRAWAFNLDEATLRSTVLDPWAAGTPPRFGDREWDPKTSTLRVLEGERLEPADLAHGQGWHRAQRTGHDVTGELLATALRVTVVASTEGGHAAAAEALGDLRVSVVDWTTVRDALLAAERRDVPVQAAVVVSEPDAPAEWHFDAGLAVGALGPRAVVVDAAALGTVAERLRRAGCPIRPRPRPPSP